MVNTLGAFGALFAAAFVFLTGNGLLNTLLDSPFGLFAFWFLVNGAFAVAALYLRRQEKVAIVAVKDQVAFVPMKSTSSVVMSMDPRSDPKADS